MLLQHTITTTLPPLPPPPEQNVMMYAWVAFDVKYYRTVPLSPGILHVVTCVGGKSPPLPLQVCNLLPLRKFLDVPNNQTVVSLFNCDIIIYTFVFKYFWNKIAYEKKTVRSLKLSTLWSFMMLNLFDTDDVKKLPWSTRCLLCSILPAYNLERTIQGASKRYLDARAILQHTHDQVNMF